ncbi:hypothetical protein FIBSPDRAFT_879980 [Athelia psychrophila]|uniref:Uncharacterized protein n=1 Tax=Athelia psychrophila TaxID=1759441 RepID=A0A167TEE9_9AGAM|nr:hypothetical protein FIBSPDRAFT_879980 [Fibularhizoctonia sp. CBS 109695]
MRDSSTLSHHRAHVYVPTPANSLAAQLMVHTTLQTTGTPQLPYLRVDVFPHGCTPAPASLRLSHRTGTVSHATRSPSGLAAVVKDTTIAVNTRDEAPRRPRALSPYFPCPRCLH